LVVYDISQAGNPRQIAFMPVSGSGLHRLWYTGGRWAYASALIEGFSDFIFITIDMGDPKRPIIAGRFWLPGMNLAAGGKTGLAYGWALRLPEGRRVFPYMSVRDNLMMGAFSRSETASMRASFDDVLARFPRLKDRLRQAAGTMSGGEQQMLVIGRALMAKPWLLLLDEPSLGVATKIVQDIARSIVAINRDEKVSVLLVEQNSRMALRISNRAMR
jgi:branched-chain amino acid transport system ATP-binding protein